ncbi:MAG: hypothetical protein WC729_03560 [Sphingomonas sp.]|jgi:hypothetical protein|uniref:hypothetical protein n=1 Tax=Sphingomonas sp. TaxID=28214 RepID=UPI003563DCDB
MGGHSSEGADDLGNHLQIIASAMHLIERSLAQDAALRPLTRCALESVDRVATLVLPQRSGPARIV